MKDILAIIIIFGAFGTLILFTIKHKSKSSKLDAESDEFRANAKTHKNSIFGPVTFMIAILLFVWSVVCFCGGPDAEKGLRPIVYGALFLLISLVLGYKSIK